MRVISLVWDKKKTVFVCVWRSLPTAVICVREREAVQTGAHRNVLRNGADYPPIISTKFV